MDLPTAPERSFATGGFAAGSLWVEVAAATEVGPDRHYNEDTFVLAPELGLIAAIDGAGGTYGGAVASAIAARTLVAALGGAGAPGAAPLAAAFCAASAAIAEGATSELTLTGMCCTAAAVWFGAAAAVIAHVGDCRVYRWRAGALTALTRDHSLINAAIDAGQVTAEQLVALAAYQGVITRAVGFAATVEVDTTMVELVAGDRLILCSDGVNATLAEGRLAVLAGGADLARAVADILFAAFTSVEEGKYCNNATVVIAAVSEPA